MKKIVATSIIAAAGLAISTLSFAAAMPVSVPSPHGWYVGIGANSIPFTAAHVTTGDDVTLYRAKYSLNQRNIVGGNLFVGYRFTQYFGTELGVQLLGNAKYKSVEGYNIKEQNTWHGYYDGTLYLPVYRWFEVFAKGGVGYFHRSETVNNSPIGSYTNMLNTFALNVGAGAQVNIYSWAVRATYMHIITQDGSDLYVDIPDTINLDVLYHFG